MDSGEFPYVVRIVADAKTPHMDNESAFERAVERLLTGIERTIVQAPQ
jgi:hypothetical protein